MSGYDLARLFDRSMGHLWSARHNQIYPLLAQLAADGLIYQAATGPRNRKTYEITDEGLRAIRRWLLETQPSRTVRDEATLRTYFLWLLEPGQARDYLLREAEHYEALLAEYRSLAAAPTHDEPAEQAMRIGIQAGLRYAKAMSQWAEWAGTQFDPSEVNDPAAGPSASRTVD